MQRKENPSVRPPVLPERNYELKSKIKNVLKMGKNDEAMFNFNKIAKATERRQKQDAENTQAGNSNNNGGNGQNNPPPAN